MKERGTLFQLAMVTALLADLKTHTRRILKPQPSDHHWQLLPGYELKTTGPLLLDNMKMGVRFHHTIPQNPEWASDDWVQCPYGMRGDRIWVRETFYAFGRWETRYSAKKGRDEWHFVDLTIEAGFKHLFEEPVQWKRSKRETVTPTWWKRPAIFMPRVASRITLEITGVRVERLQDISEADALAEGLSWMVRDYGKERCFGVPETADLPSYEWAFANWAKTAIEAYKRLWESINGDGSWDINPLVWVIEFKVIKP